MFRGRLTHIFSPLRGIRFYGRNIQYGLLSHTASTAVSDTIMSSLLFFYIETGKCSQKTRHNTAEILRK